MRYTYSSLFHPWRFHCVFSPGVDCVCVGSDCVRSRGDVCLEVFVWKKIIWSESSILPDTVSPQHAVLPRSLYSTRCIYMSPPPGPTGLPLCDYVRTARSDAKQRSTAQWCLAETHLPWLVYANGRMHMQITIETMILLVDDLYFMA